VAGLLSASSGTVAGRSARSLERIRWRRKRRSRQSPPEATGFSKSRPSAQARGVFNGLDRPYFKRLLPSEEFPLATLSQVGALPFSARHNGNVEAPSQLMPEPARRSSSGEGQAKRGVFVPMVTMRSNNAFERTGILTR
jgi:hypothetical protein